MARGLAHQRPHVRHVAGQLDAESIAIPLLLFPACAADPPDWDVADEGSHSGQDSIGKKLERVAIWKRACSANVSDSRSGVTVGVKLVGIDTIWHDCDA